MEAPARPLYIFDIDGTLCDITHRLHFLNDVCDKDRWKKFYRACASDKAILPVISIMEALKARGADIWFLSGRSNEVRRETIMWLHVHTSFTKDQLEAAPELLNLRLEGDHREDHDLKYNWLASQGQADVNRLVCVFEDRKRVVDMWRTNGVPCMQVSAGDF